MNPLESLNRYNTVVAETGDPEAVGERKPCDAAEPSLL
jgi:hypothetical protein